MFIKTKIRRRPTYVYSDAGAQRRPKRPPSWIRIWKIKFWLLFWSFEFKIFHSCKLRLVCGRRGEVDNGIREAPKLNVESVSQWERSTLLYKQIIFWSNCFKIGCFPWITWEYKNDLGSTKETNYYSLICSLSLMFCLSVSSNRYNAVVRCYIWFANVINWLMWTFSGLV